MKDMRPLSLAEQIASLSPEDRLALMGREAVASAAIALTGADMKRLAAQTKGVRDVTLNRGWLTLRDIENATGYPQASISARLRGLRRQGYRVDKRRKTIGTWEYSVQERAP